MRQGVGSALFQIMACRLFGPKPLSQPMLDLCQLDRGNKLQWNLNENSKLFIHENAFENSICEMAAILSRGRWVNQHQSHTKQHVYMPLQLLGVNILLYSISQHTGIILTWLDQNTPLKLIWKKTTQKTKHLSMHVSAWDQIRRRWM